MGWRESGAAWGYRAVEWAYLYEPWTRPMNDVVLDRTGVAAGTRVLDVGCGSGLAMWVAAGRGAQVHGLDAAEHLLAIARARTPDGDFREGDFAALPWPDGEFDVVTAFNSIWYGEDAALAEAARVLRPGGALGMTFWGSPKRMGLLAYFATVAALSPPDHVRATIDQGETGRPGVAEAMLQRAGLAVAGRGRVTMVNEWPDVATAVRALVAAGPSVPAVEAVGEERFAAALADALAPFDSGDTGVRVASELGWVTARKPD
jgi:SAM-dependent methyltransferase